MSTTLLLAFVSNLLCTDVHSRFMFQQKHQNLSGFAAFFLSPQCVFQTCPTQKRGAVMTKKQPSGFHGSIRGSPPLQTSRPWSHPMASRLQVDLEGIRITSVLKTVSFWSVPSGKLTWLAGISPIFNRKYIFISGPCSIAMLVYRSVSANRSSFSRNRIVET